MSWNCFQTILLCVEDCNTLNVCCCEVSVCNPATRTLLDPQSSQTEGMIHVCVLSWSLWRFPQSRAQLLYKGFLGHRSKLMAKYHMPCSVIVYMCRLRTVCLQTHNYCHLSELNDAMFSIMTPSWQSHSIIWHHHMSYDPLGYFRNQGPG